MKFKETAILGRMTWQVMLAKLTKFPRPVSVNLQLTKICNLDCEYCFADMESLKQERVKDPTTKELFETIDELYKYGCRHIIMMGGEPLIRKDIYELVNYIKSKWMRCEIVTNGYYVEKHIEALKLCDSVCISIDGEKESNDLVRGEGCHDAVVGALKFLKANDVKIRIHSILTQHNIKSGPQYIAELAKDFAFPFNFSMIMLRPEKKPDYANLREDQIQDFLDDYKGHRDKGYPVFTSDATFDYMKKWPMPGQPTIFKDDPLTSKQWKDVVPCNYGQYNAFVDTDGCVYKCAVTWKNGLNWREHGMKAALGHIGKNLINCVSCRSIGDIERALLLNFSSWNNIKMVFKYLSTSVTKKLSKVADHV